MRYILIGAGLAAALGGCVHSTCEDCDTGPPIPAVTVYDDGMTLTVIGCAAQPFDSNCIWGDQAMTATIAGVTMTVPAAASTDDTVIGGDAIRYDHRLDVPSPTGAADLAAVYGAVATEDFSDLPAFTITGPSAPVSRSSGAIAIDYMVLQATSALALLTTTCAGSASEPGQLPVTETGHIDLDLSQLHASGSCSHEVDISQIQDLLASPPSDLDQSVVRVATLSFDSTP